ncbi:MAG: M28 family peptidase, partial [Bacteroidales bacterium]|nr:M28 family peptidase [Bacteroidales bacterium]
MKKFTLIVALLILATAGLFSQNERGADLRKHVEALVADSLMGRGAGSEGEKMAARYIRKVFNESSVELLYPLPGQDFSLVNSNGDTIRSQNIIGIVEGYDPQLKNEFILIGAHYDHLGFNTVKVNGRDSLTIYRGADDNASGVSVMLEVAK